MPLVQLSLTHVGLGADHGAVGAFHSVDEAVARPAGGAFQKAGIKELVIEPWFGVFDRRPPQLPPELCKFQRDADPGLCRRVPSQLGWPSGGPAAASAPGREYEYIGVGQGPIGLVRLKWS